MSRYILTTLIAQKHSFSHGLSIILMWIPIFPRVKFFDTSLLLQILMRNFGLQALKNRFPFVSLIQ